MQCAKPPEPRLALIAWHASCQLSSGVPICYGVCGNRTPWQATVSKMARPYTPLAAANYLIGKFGGDRGIEHMKLQKLVYCAHGWWLTAYQDPFLNDRPEVWKYGPVFSTLYHNLKEFGLRPIREPQRVVFNEGPPTIDESGDEERALLNWIWGQYGHHSALYLSDLTHKEGTPWQVTAKKHNYRVPKHLKSDDELIRDHFRQLAMERGYQVA